jgi:hypothetical protein
MKVRFETVVVRYCDSRGVNLPFLVDSYCRLYSVKNPFKDLAQVMSDVRSWNGIWKNRRRFIDGGLIWDVLDWAFSVDWRLWVRRVLREYEGFYWGYADFSNWHLATNRKCNAVWDIQVKLFHGSK